MLTLDIDLNVMTLEELAEARQAVHHDIEEVEAHDPQHMHLQLTYLFEALEHALEREAAERTASRHEIAEALAIDEETGEWLAGA
ncbi:MAG TPA: hypothetical protein VK939_03240 [Longimicrobiales bacterium]|nr:hypothetical protein [Longimicrobiales bacterium]